MILLLAGTSESVSAAEALLEAGFQVLASTATDEPLKLPNDHPRLRRQAAELDANGLVSLMEAEEVRCVVDAAHPYAQALHANVREACRRADLPCLRYDRASTPLPEDCIRVATHAEAAVRASAGGKPILLTVGSRHVATYTEAARKADARLTARVLPREDSIRACREAGLDEDEIVADRGPFTEEQTLALLRERGIGVLVTKESGPSGGLPEKLVAARRAGARVIVVDRPAIPAGTPIATNTTDLLAWVRAQCSEATGRRRIDTT